jgi:hypothetical protein
LHCVWVSTAQSCEASLGGSPLQNCGQEDLPAPLGAASRLRRLRITDVRYSPIYFEKDDLDTLSSMRSLSFLSFTQARLWLRW